MNLILKTLAKICLSFVIAFVVLSLFCSFYYKTPVHYENKDGSTDYVWQKNYHYSRGTEGIGYGKTNNEGLMNEFDYEAGMNIDVLVLGSSHMENQFIPMDKNCVSLLNDLFEDKTFYNAGVSGHNFKVCIDNLPYALNKYQPAYVIIETSSLIFDEETVNKMINGEIGEIESHAGGLKELLQKNPFIRLAYSQYDALVKNNKSDDEYEAPVEKVIDEAATSKLMAFISSIGQINDCQVVILYHPTIDTYDDCLTYRLDEDIVSEFKDICIENDVAFIDMTAHFNDEYSEKHLVPYGFNNTAVGVGHLNVEGHRMIAEEIIKYLKEVE